MTAEVLLPVGALAVLDTLSPTTIGITLYLVLTAQRLARPLFTYLATVALSYFALGAVLMLGLGAVVNVVDERVALVGQAVVGAGLLIGSWFIPDRKPGAAPPTPTAHTAAAMVLLGVTTWALEAATALPYFGAVGIMTAAGLTTAQWPPVLAGYTVVMVLPSVALYAAWRVAGPRLQPAWSAGGTRSAPTPAPPCAGSSGSPASSCSGTRSPGSPRRAAPSTSREATGRRTGRRR